MHLSVARPVHRELSSPGIPEIESCSLVSTRPGTWQGSASAGPPTLLTGRFGPRLRSAAIEARNDFDNPGSPCQWYERELLALLALEMDSKRRVHVLDFGGGPATTFFQLFSIAGKIPAGDLRYDIIDAGQLRGRSRAGANKRARPSGRAR